MDLTPSDWIAICGVFGTFLFGILGIFAYKHKQSKKIINTTNLSAEQKSGAFSSGNQHMNVKIENNNE